MFCKNCGNEIKKADRFCEKCGYKIDYFDNNQTDSFVDNSNVNDSELKENLTVQNTSELPEELNSVSEKKKHTLTKKQKVAICCVSIFFAFSLVVLLMAVLGFFKSPIEKYISENPIIEEATDITFSYDDMNMIASDYSYDIVADTTVSNRLIDIDEDGVDEMINVSIIRDGIFHTYWHPTISIYDDDMETICVADYSTVDENGFSISLDGNKEYYIFITDKNTVLVVEHDKERSADVIVVYDIDNNSFVAECTHTEYDNGNYSYYDPINNIDIDSNTGNSLTETYNLSMFSGYRVMMSSYGANDFMTGTRDVENIMLYSDIIPVGKFTITIENSNGNFKYEDLEKE